MHMLSHMSPNHMTLTTESNSCWILFKKIICKADSQVANLQTTKIIYHSHKVWDERKPRTGCPLVKVVILSKQIVDETCDCECCKDKNEIWKKEIKHDCQLPHFFVFRFMQIFPI